MKLGSTGRFPRGKLTEEDRGELRMEIMGFIENGRQTVVLEFGEETKWVAFGPEHAKELGRALIAAAQVLEDAAANPPPLPN